MNYVSTIKYASCSFCNKPLDEKTDFMQSPMSGAAICLECAAEFADTARAGADEKEGAE